MIRSDIIASYSAYMAETSTAVLNQATSIVPRTDDAAKVTENTINNDIQDSFFVSEEAMKLYTANPTDTKFDDSADKDKEKKQDNPKLKDKKELTEDEKKELEKRKQTDREVRIHEQAHIAAASGINASAPSYTTEKGPDGKEYAVAGEVQLSFNETSDAEKNIQMAQAMKAAALAPAEPSSQDRAVAQKADRLIAKYNQERLSEKPSESDEDKKTDGNKETSASNNVETSQKVADSEEIEKAPESSKEFENYGSTDPESEHS